MFSFQIFKILITTSVECQEDLLAEQAAHTQITSAVLVIFFVSLLGVGVGQTAVSTLGIPYIDDNVASRESPIYIGKITKRSLLAVNLF